MSEKLTVTIGHDEDIECPNDQDGAWHLYSFCSRHTSYKHPSELGLGPLDKFGEPKITNPGLRQKLKVGLAFVLSYFEHGSCVWFRKGNALPGVEFQWDGVRVAGLLVWEHKSDEIGGKTYEARAKDADGFLEEYTAWANGEGYYYTIEDEEGDTVDSCGGFLGADTLRAELQMALKGKDYEVKGDAADLLN